MPGGMGMSTALDARPHAVLPPADLGLCAATLREAARRLDRGFPHLKRECCPACLVNPRAEIDDVLAVLRAMADRADPGGSDVNGS